MPTWSRVTLANENGTMKRELWSRRVKIVSPSTDSNAASCADVLKLPLESFVALQATIGAQMSM